MSILDNIKNKYTKNNLVIICSFFGFVTFIDEISYEKYCLISGYWFRRNNLQKYELVFLVNNKNNNKFEIHKYNKDKFSRNINLENIINSHKYNKEHNIYNFSCTSCSFPLIDIIDFEISENDALLSNILL